MSIKSDRWIRRMAREQRMIEPFAAEQVRAVDGRKIVSYGTSSYGYDVRCAPEFKIFTNINSTIVDPKAFDEKSFVDFPGDVCIIPPNSFALARTVEYFRIPRSVLTVCLGKCLTADARVVDAQSGAYVPITAMRFGRSTVALDRFDLKSAKVSAFLRQGRKQVFKLTTRAGLQIRATANHPFLMARGWAPLERLLPGDRIAVAAEIPVFGKTPLPAWEATLLGLVLAGGPPSAITSSAAAADPTLARLLRSALLAAGFSAPHQLRRWLARYDLDDLAGEQFVPQAIFTAPAEAVRLFLQALLSGADGSRPTPGEWLEYQCESRRLIEDVHHLLLRFGVFALIREASVGGTRSHQIRITDAGQMQRFAARIGLVPGSARQRCLAAQSARLLRATAQRIAFGGAACETQQIRQFAAGAGGRVGPVLSHAHETSAAPLQARQGAPAAQSPRSPQAVRWDAVETVEPAGVEEVFDISVPMLHNFVANGLIVHNSTYARCGIICNVTPLEPEWEGHVTLEFSNTTPLPAKIYANEGVAQMLFFESDELCETSYRDRGGKYMGQKGVTLPKA